MKTPTMIYAPVDDKYFEPGQTYKGDGYYYKVVDAEEVSVYLKKGWSASPIKPKTEKTEKDSLERYAKKKHGVDLDKRKSIETLKDEVAKLDAG